MQPGRNSLKFRRIVLSHVRVYADDVNLLGDSVDTIQKNTQTLIDASKEVGLKINTEKSKYSYMLLSRHLNAGQNHDKNR
jgi:hypothetical protein